MTTISRIHDERRRPSGADCARTADGGEADGGAFMNDRPLLGAAVAAAIVLALSWLILEDLGLGRLHAPLTVSAFCYGATTWARPLARPAVVLGGALVVVVGAATAAQLADVLIPGWVVASSATAFASVVGAARLASNRS